MQSITCREARSPRIRRAAAAGVVAISLSATCALAAEPRVPYVPTPQGVVDRMLEIAKVVPADYLIDLGSGDGRIVITAAKKHGARGFGVDLDPNRIKESVENARRAGVTDRVAFHQRNLFETDLSQATVITMYLLPRVNIELRPKLLALAPGTRLVSHDFDMDDWKADTHLVIQDPDKYGGTGGTSDIYFWVVPARVAGDWHWQAQVGGKPQAYEIRLEQKFQAISGTVRTGGRVATLQGASLRGAEIRFHFSVEVNGSPVKHSYSGRVDGEAINGSAELSGPRMQARIEWSASRGSPRAAPGHDTPARVARVRAGGTLN